MPLIHVIAGPNGAGKTTVGLLRATELGIAFLNADEIAKQISPPNPSGVKFVAGRKMLAAIGGMLDGRKSFVIESTLSGRTLSRTLRTAQRDMGYEVDILYMFMPSANECVERVARRVANGGHDVPEEDVRRRFVRSAVNFRDSYGPLANRWRMWHNGAGGPSEIARKNGVTVTIDHAAFKEFNQIDP